jgi:DNA gyrase subunit A
VLQLKDDEKIASVIPVREFTENTFLLMATKAGVVKKTGLMEYSRPRQGGIIGINLEEGDSLIDVCLTKPGDEVVLSTRNGMAIRFGESDARAMGRNSTGVYGIKLNQAKEDFVVGMVVADPDGFLLTLCENGYGKRTPFGANTVGTEDGELGEGEMGSAEEEETKEAPAAETDNEGEEAETQDKSAMRYRKQRRGGKGVKDVKVTAKNGPVVGVISVRDGDEIMVITQQGMVVRTAVETIRIVGRNTQGVKIMTPNDGDKIKTMAKLAPEAKPSVEEEKL